MNSRIILTQNYLKNDSFIDSIQCQHFRNYTAKEDIRNYTDLLKHQKKLKRKKFYVK